MTTLRRLVFVCFALSCAARAAAEEAPSAQPPSAAAPAAAASAEAAPQSQVRVVAALPAASEPRFAIAPVSEPAHWQLVLAGLAAAVWVAHRRLRYSY